MIKLYGVKPSNYYSMAKAILIEKELEFEEVANPPSQEESFLVKSPMGKMPAIEVDGTFLSETIAIAQWAEQVKPEPALMPGDAMATAKVMELCCHLKLDIELVARRCLPAAFFGAEVSEETMQATRADLVRGLKAVDRLLKAAPYAAGDQFTLADIFYFYTFGLSNAVTMKILDMDLFADYPRFSELQQKLAGHPTIARVEQEKA